jgi:hypothetical protein
VPFGRTEVRVEDGRVFVDGKDVPTASGGHRDGKEIRVENGQRHHRRQGSRARDEQGAAR